MVAWRRTMEGMLESILISGEITHPAPESCCFAPQTCAPARRHWPGRLDDPRPSQPPAPAPRLHHNTAHGLTVLPSFTLIGSPMQSCFLYTFSFIILAFLYIHSLTDFSSFLYTFRLTNVTEFMHLILLTWPAAIALS